MSTTTLPFFMQGKVVKGFGRGSKDLGCPTANYALEVIKTIPKTLEPGVYCGWAKVDDGPVQKMVANVGWCPFYGNKEISVETHIMERFDKDFYGSNLKITLVKYLRAELNFKSLEELKETIKCDIQNAKEVLESPQSLKIKSHKHFSNNL